MRDIETLMSLVSDNDPTLSLAKEILAVASVSPDQSGVQEVLALRLEKSGFVVERRELCGCKNFWARIGTAAPLLVFSGHTDVVPAGEPTRWTTPPFEPAIRDGSLFARGAADMKGSLAAMVIAAEKFVRDCRGKLPFSLGFLVTGDEEIGGAAAKSYLDHLSSHNQKIDYCLVGEPSSVTQLGDTLKIGRRGSLRGKLTIRGTQGHVGYPQLADNALHRAVTALQALTDLQWKDGNEFFDPTSFQVTSLHSGVAENVIPGDATATFNFRYAITTSAEEIMKRIDGTLSEIAGLSYTLSWTLDAEPFITTPGGWTNVVIKTVKNSLGISPKLSTSGGTSDARFFAAHGVQVVELGPTNKTIHQYDEAISTKELTALTELYLGILRELAKQPAV